MIQIRIGRLAWQIGVHRNTVGNWIRTGALAARPIAGRRYAIEKNRLIRFLASRGVDEALAAEIAENCEPLRHRKEEEQPKQPPMKTKEVSMSNKTIGSVMVVGGGIASIQASLDLADSGYYVHLVEKNAGIGGRMAQLDKTFPTNDCAM